MFNFGGGGLQKELFSREGPHEFDFVSTRDPFFSFPVLNKKGRDTCVHLVPLTGTGAIHEKRLLT